ncbi:MAG: heme/copper-type cytochrome/quinol oxidase, subunit 3 [Bacteroidetes bacterium]|nr:MAG: heme/copper-type cytochrome/quinol oxidase, subunit 3 [Bacteroidota bacterium]
MIYVIIAGITVLFLTMMILFVSSKPAFHLADKLFPKSFFLSTAVILASSIFIRKARKAFARENPVALSRNLYIAALLALAFSGSQYFGWTQLWNSGIYLKGTPSGAFLYVISGLHLAHLSGGLLFLALAIIKAVRAKKDAVKGIVYFTDPLEKVRVEMLEKYWHYLDGLWIVLFLYFLWFFV